MAATAPATRPTSAARYRGPLGGPLALSAILIVALGLRLTGLGWGLPWAFHPDEIFYVDQAQDMLKFGDPDPKYFKNPSLLTYLIVGELLIAHGLGPLAGPFEPSLPGAPYLLARLTSALLGTATVALLVPLGAALFGRRVGLLAALILAVAFLHVRDSHYGVNDVPGTFWLTLSLYGAARLLREPAARWYALAGLTGGLAVSTKYNMGFFFVPILAAHILGGGDAEAEKRGEEQAELLSRSLRLAFSRSLRPLGLAAAAALAGYLLGTPYTILDFPRFLADFQVQYGYGNQRWLGQPLEPVPLLYLTSLVQGFGAMPLALALAGLTLAWRRQRAAVALLLACPVTYLAFLLSKQLFFPRFVIPLLPSLCLLAAYGALGLADGVRQRRRDGEIERESDGGDGPGGQKERAGGPLLLLSFSLSFSPSLFLSILLVAALAQPLWYDLLHTRLLLETDTRVIANDWIQANLPRGSRLKIEDYSLRDVSTASRTYTPNSADLKIERFEGSPEAEQARYFAERNVQYVVTSSFAYDRYLLDPPLPVQQESGARHQRLHRSLEQRAELVARFSPGPGNLELPYRLDDVMTPFWGLEQYERPGPTIRIYSVAHVAQ